MKQYIDVPVPMRDGVRLSTDIRHPDGPGPFPTLVVRTPYSNATTTGYRRHVEAGYAVVAQDCRGRFDSDGRFHPFFEAEDGFDTLAWARAQPWCDGRFGMFGASYIAYTQFAAARLCPPGLKALAPRVMGRDAFRDMLYHNGIFALSLAAGWGFGMVGRGGQCHATTDWPQVFRHLPLIEMDEVAGYHAPFFREWLSHPVYDEYWSALSVEQHYACYDQPILHVGGWYDVYLDGLLRNYMGLRAQGGPMARAHQKLIIGPWAHCVDTRALGPVDFGEQALVDLDAVELRWLDRWVRDVPNGIEQEPPVRIFVMGANVWRDEWEWPLARAEESVLHLVSGGHANGVAGDGALSADGPAGAEADAYGYDPADPVPTVGGCLLGGSAGPHDHAAIEGRADVLVFTGPELREPLEVTGFVKAVLYVASDAPDTDFIARLCDVYPDGRSLIVCDGVVRMRFREGLDREVSMEPGCVYEATIEMGATSLVFAAGHRLRVEVTSSCFPRFARNLNTGEPIATATRLRVARQTLCHARAHPSRVILPVVPGSGNT